MDTEYTIYTMGLFVEKIFTSKMFDFIINVVIKRESIGSGVAYV